MKIRLVNGPLNGEEYGMTYIMREIQLPVFKRSFTLTEEPRDVSPIETAVYEQRQDTWLHNPPRYYHVYTP